MSYIKIGSIVQSLKDVPLAFEHQGSVVHMRSENGTCKLLEDPDKVLDGVDPDPLKHALFTKLSLLAGGECCQRIEPWSLHLTHQTPQRLLTAGHIRGSTGAPQKTA